MRSVRSGKVPFEFFIKSIKTLKAIDDTLVYLPDYEGKVLLLKTSSTSTGTMEDARAKINQ